jgi:hypothetical protein
MDQSILNWLLEQAGLVVVMGIISTVLYRRYDQAEKDKLELAKDVIKLASAYENKIDRDKERDAEIKAILMDIRDRLPVTQRRHD